MAASRAARVKINPRQAAAALDSLREQLTAQGFGGEQVCIDFAGKGEKELIKNEGSSFTLKLSLLRLVY